MDKDEDDIKVTIKKSQVKTEKTATLEKRENDGKTDKDINYKNLNGQLNIVKVIWKFHTSKIS